MKKIVWAALVLSLLCLVAYEPIRHNGFVSFDDSKYITANKEVLSGLSHKTFVWAFSTTHFHSWHPLTWLSHAFDCTLFGLNPLGHHLHSLLLHMVNAILFLVILMRLTKNLVASTLATSLWALHPLRVEAVAWATCRKDMLVGLFFLLALYFFLQYRQREDKLSYGFLCLFFICGLLSKPMIVTLPFLLLILDFFYGDEFKKPFERFWRSSLAELLPLFLLTLFFSILFYWTQASGGALSPLAKLSFGAKLANAICSYALYLWQTLYPLGLSCLYPHPEGNYSQSLVVVSFFILLVITFGLVKLRNRDKTVLLGWFWYLGTLVPVIGLVQLGTHARADRFTYIPAMGLSLLLGRLLLLFDEKRGRWVQIFLLLLLLFSIHFTRSQTMTWRDSNALYENALLHTKNNYVIHNNLGAHLQAMNKLEAAEEQFRQAIKIHPDFAEAQLNLVDLLEKKGKNDEASVIFQKLAKKFPNYAPVHFKLGQLARARGEYGEACIHLKKAISLAPDLAPAHNDYGLALRALGRNEEAKVQFLRATALDSKLAASWFNLAIMAHVAGKPKEALGLYKKAIVANENFVEAWANLAVAFQSLNLLDESEEAYQRALRLKANNLDVIINYAILLRRRGKFSLAAKEFERALLVGGPNREVESALKEALAAQ